MFTHHHKGLIGDLIVTENIDVIDFTELQPQNEYVYFFLRSFAGAEAFACELAPFVETV